MARRKINRKPGHATVKANHDAWLRSMGINPDKKAKSPKKGVYDIPDYKSQSTNTIKTSDTICSNGSKRESIRYTGNEIAGVALMHKQNYEPIRKDNKQAAVQSSQMRRN
jgi:hypothetical protein